MPRENTLFAPEQIDLPIGESEPWREAMDKAIRAAAADYDILLTGESGTGKEVVARFIHAHSGRRAGPFRDINAGKSGDDLVNGDLFGHIKGAFTGAVADRLGIFELAEGGTVLLDEIGDAPIGVQVKLLRVLQERCITPLGGQNSRRVNARIIAATNADLQAAIGAGKFREDLFYRLNVISIRLPSLRERGDDIILLARFFLAKSARECRRQDVSLNDDILTMLRRYSWPGNVRQLENAIKGVVALAGDRPIRMEDVERALAAGMAKAPRIIPDIDAIEPPARPAVTPPQRPKAQRELPALTFCPEKYLEALRGYIALEATRHSLTLGPDAILLRLRVQEFELRHSGDRLSDLAKNFKKSVKKAKEYLTQDANAGFANVMCEAFRAGSLEEHLKRCLEAGLRNELCGSNQPQQKLEIIKARLEPFEGMGEWVEEAIRILDIDLSALEPALLTSPADSSPPAQPVSTLPPPAVSPAALSALSLSVDGLDDYLKAVCAQHQKLPLIGVNPELKLSLDIDEVYVPLRAAVNRSLYHEQKYRGADVTACEESGDVELARAFACAGKKRGLIILGDPGSGKTTLLKLLLVHCIQKGPETLGLPPGTVPVMLPLRELKGDQNLDDFVTRLLRQDTHLRLTDDFPATLRKARPLVYLLDGLDEVPDEKERARVSRWIRSALDTHTTACFAVTSRYAGYQGEARLDDHFLELNVRPLREAEAQRLVGNFYRIVERYQAQVGTPALDEAGLHAADVDAKEKAEHLWSLLESDTYRTRRMRELQTNPLLLTIVCLVHQRYNSLPVERWRLYEQCVDTLLWHWQKAKNLTLPFEKLDHALRLLRPLAWWLHQQEQRRHASSDNVVKALGQVLSRLGVDGDRMSQFLREVRDRSGLLVGWGPDSYGFIHLAFQEYLTAVETKIKSYGSPRLLEELSKHFGESWWTEVILLLVSLPDPCLFEPLMGQLLQRDTFALPANQTLLADCVSDAAERAATPFLAVAADATRSVEVRYAALAALRGFKDEQKAEVIEGCRSLLKAPERTLRDLARELLVARGEKVAVALEAGTVWIHPATGLEFVYVPAGSFVMGSDKYDAEKPLHKVTFARGFWMGKYPVTNEQYGRFLEANRGYGQPAYWEDREWNGPRQPVVEVTWKDARAYSQWADGVLREGGEGLPDGGDAILLPSEAMWEYAARGPEGREYPWGEDDPTPELANYIESENGRTTPVGQYPKGASWVGALDMAGNVWEWCADHWHDTYEGASSDGSPWIDNNQRGNDSVRVFRGGSWNRNPISLRGAFRDGRRAGHCFENVGFRLCLGSVPAEHG